MALATEPPLRVTPIDHVKVPSLSMLEKAMLSPTPTVAIGGATRKCHAGLRK